MFYFSTLLVLFAVVYFVAGSANKAIEAAEESRYFFPAFLIIFITHITVFLLSISLFCIYLLVLSNNTQYRFVKRLLIALLLFLFGPLSLPLFWYLQVYKRPDFSLEVVLRKEGCLTALLLGVLVLVGYILIAVIVTFSAFAISHQHPVYKYASRLAMQSDLIKREIGEPLSIGPSGRFQYDMLGLSLSFIVKGPKGYGAVDVGARKVGKGWELYELKFRNAATRKDIDLLPTVDSHVPPVENKAQKKMPLTTGCSGPVRSRRDKLRRCSFAW
jgi:hypothetical protein